MAYTWKLFPWWTLVESLVLVTNVNSLLLLFLNNLPSSPFFSSSSLSFLPPLQWQGSMITGQQWDNEKGPRHMQEERSFSESEPSADRRMETLALKVSSGISKLWQRLQLEFLCILAVFGGWSSRKTGLKHSPNNHSQVYITGTKDRLKSIYEVQLEISWRKARELHCQIWGDLRQIVRSAKYYPLSVNPRLYFAKRNK